MAQIGGQCHPRPAAGDGVTYTARGVVGGGEGLHPQFPQLEASAGLQRPAQPRQCWDFSLQAVQSGGGGVNGHPQLLGQGGQTGDVVGVLVGDQHRAEPGGIGPQRL